MVSTKLKATRKEIGPHAAKAEHDTHDAWYYAERDGLLIVAELRSPDGLHIGTTMARLTKSQLRQALKTMERA